MKFATNIAAWGHAVSILILCGCVAMPQPSRGQEVRWTIDLAAKALVRNTNYVAVRETVPVRLINTGTSQGSDLTVRLYDSTNQLMAISAAFTNVPGTNQCAGTIDLNTVQLVTSFSNYPADQGQNFNLVVWDSAQARALVNGAIIYMQNTAYAPGQSPSDALTNVNYLTGSTVFTGSVSGVYSNLQFSQRGTQELTRIINALMDGATNFIFNLVTNPSGYMLFTGYTSATRTAYFNLGTNGAGGSAIDTNSIIALINASTNTSARLASNVWADADSTTNYVRRNGDTMTSALKILRTNDIGLTFGAFGTRNSIFGVGQNDALGSGLTFVPHTANPGVPVWTLGGVYDVSSGVMYGTALRGSGLGEIDGTIGAGDFFRLEFIGADSVTQRMLTVSADALGVTGSSALLSISNATFNGNGSGISNINSGVLTNLGAGLAILGGKLVATNAGGGSSSTTNNYIDVKAPPYNAPGGGADSTAAFLAAFTNRGPCTIFVPGDTYTLTTSVRVLPYQTVLFGGAVISNATATQGVFFANAATGFTMFGSAYLRGTGSGVGLLISNSVAWKISGLDIRRFAEGIHVSGTNLVAVRGSGGQASGIYVAECGLGANFEAGSSAEYNTFVGSKFVNCWTGMYLAAGNINLDACTISENTNGLRVTGGGYNSVHPVITGLQHAHNGTASAWAMLIENVTNGVFFNGGLLADTSANTIITNSINVAVRNATIAAQTFKSYNSTVTIADNMMIDGGSSVTAVGGKMMVFGNSGTNGQWEGNQPAACYVSAFRGNNTNLNITSNHFIMVCNVVSNDLLGAYSTNTGLFTAPWSGFLTVNASAYVVATTMNTNNYIEINQNSDQGANNPWGIFTRFSSTEAMGQITVRTWVNKGDTVGVGVNITGATSPYFYGSLNKCAVQFLMGAP